MRAKRHPFCGANYAERKFDNVTKLDNVRTFYGFVPGLIKTFEHRQCPLLESIQAIDAAVGILASAQGDIAASMMVKLSDLLEKNEGLQTLRELAAVHSGETARAITGYRFSPQEISAFRYAPVSSCDVERSFSQYKAVLRDNRNSFDFDNLVQHLIVRCNP
jgi:hypothetical protein